MVRPPSSPRVTQDFGCVEVFDELTQLPVAIGQLTLYSSTEGALDFAACGTAPPTPGWYTLGVEGRQIGALVRAAGPQDPPRMLVSLDEPISA